MNKEEKERLRKSVGSLFERAQFHADFYDGGEMSDEIKEALADRHGIPLWRVGEILMVARKYGVD